MSEMPIALLSSAMTHGARILAGSPDRTVNGLPVVRLGDPVLCPQHGHGLNSIASVLVSQETDGRPCAHVIARAACGAVIISGSPDTVIG